MIRRLLPALLALAATMPASAAVSFGGYLAVPGDATDLARVGSGPNDNRLSFGSDLFYDDHNRLFYGLADRGPGGGVIDYKPRFHTFTLNISPTGAPSDFRLRNSVVLTQAGGSTYTGLNPVLGHGDARTLGNSLDPEGIVRLPDGHLLISDEYGPAISEYTRSGQLVRTFATPANIQPRDAGGPDYQDGRPVLTSGRQDNRGFEGLALSRDGRTLYAVLQDPLVTEGDGGDGRLSKNVRIVRFDVATGAATGQFIYQLEDRADINARLPAGANTFGKIL